MTFLTNTELDYLLGKREFSRDQSYYIKSRLLKEVKALYGIELPLLDEKGFLDNLAACSKDLAACSKDLAAGCKEVSSSSGDLVAQPGRAKELLERENDKSPRWASIPQPRVSVLPPTTTEGAERIMSAAELLNPAKQVCDRSTTYKEDYYLCWSCLKEERGACSMSQAVQVAPITTRNHKMTNTTTTIF